MSMKSLICRYFLLCAVVQFHHTLALKPLHLLLILPLNSSATTTDSWERGSQLLAAAERAVEAINQDTNILQDYRLEMSRVNSVTCTPPHEVATLPSFLNATVYTQDREILAAVGIFCPHSAKLLTKLTRHPGLRFPVFVGSLSPTTAVATEFPFNQFRMLDSSLSIAQAVVSFMEYQHWTRIAVITDIDNTYYLQTAEAFLKHMKNLRCINQTNISVSFYLQARNSIQLGDFDAKVVIVSASLKLSRQIISKASANGWTWPTHAWLFHTHSPEDLITNAPISGLFFFQNSLIESECHERKTEQLHCSGVVDLFNPYAHILNKTIRLSALLKNMTLLNTSLDYTTALRLLSSSGLMEGLAFDDTTHTLFNSSVHISQTTGSGELVGIGHYHSRQGHLNITNATLPQNQIPSGIVLHSREVVISVLYFTEISLCFILVTIDLLLYIYYRKEPEVKATSFSVSISMFLSSYVLILYLVLLSTGEGRSGRQTRYTDAVCLARSWLNILSIPGTLTVATVLIKILRVYTIFRPDNFSRIGKRYSDPAVFLYIILLQIPTIIIGLLWTFLDRYTNRTTLTQKTNFVSMKEECYSVHLSLWPSLLVGYNCLLTIALAVVAIKTRKIRRAHFKDTKKVNVFVFVYFFLTGFMLSLWITGRRLNLVAYSEATLNIGHTSMVVLVQVTLFVPKLYPPLMRRVCQRHRRRGSVETTSSSLRSLITKYSGFSTDYSTDN